MSPAAAWAAAAGAAKNPDRAVLVGASGAGLTRTRSGMYVLKTRASGLVGCMRLDLGNPRCCHCSGWYCCCLVGNGDCGGGDRWGHCMSCDGHVRRLANDIRADGDVHLSLSPPSLSPSPRMAKKTAIADGAETGKASGCSAGGRRVAEGSRIRRRLTRKTRRIRCRQGDLDSSSCPVPRRTGEDPRSMAGCDGCGDASQDHLARLALSSVARLERVDVEAPVLSTSAARISRTTRKFEMVLCVTREDDEVQASASHHRLPLHGHSMEERAAMGLRLHSA